MNPKSVRKHTEADVYNAAFKPGMRIFEFSKASPIKERYSLTDQVRRSSRSVLCQSHEGMAEVRKNPQHARPNDRHRR